VFRWGRTPLDDAVFFKHAQVAALFGRDVNEVVNGASVVKEEAGYSCASTSSLDSGEKISFTLGDGK
jgi:hypothetical protein